MGTPSIKKHLYTLSALTWLTILLLPVICDAHDALLVPDELRQRSDIELVPVKGGCFQMGEFILESAGDEKPVHEVCVSDFMIAKYEVTQGQWKQFMGNRPSNFRDCGDSCPVEQVSWNEVQQFIQRLNRQTGLQFRLPSEAEWEYACRSGGKQEKFCGGNDIDVLAWHHDNSDGRPHPVGQKKPNGLGIYDMSGNVWEWVQDWFDTSYYSKSPRMNPQGPTTSSEKAVRGGCWDCEPKCIRASIRYWFAPNGRFSGLGFRLAHPTAVSVKHSGGKTDEQ
ncbi:formylglycine-generating enzyme family protein [Trichlorobacter lovleyi]|uniref:Sulfatase-modifying factor enzyme-like domain-containing protein n=1 Tax=Trichlorobacter lovleyi (strain ATCC BAA-1151 / DSM 17278 / SZ) TaxID=398767 RepID=B3E6R6_TRIL1|nr:formylglycine-generating enzyme family protein [Trichlorobacter lovleyi]ACD94891.1 protein of unknown function DUF323 [Trichlorobacter lovleyi SZ]